MGQVIPVIGDRVTVNVVPAGGGGGKNIVALIAIIAISVVAPFAGTAIAGALGLSGTVATLVGSGIAAGVVVGGATLVNRFVRAPEQQLSAVEQDPVWSISGIRNTFPTRQTPIPSLFGTDRCFRTMPPARSRRSRRSRRLPQAFPGPRMRRPTMSGRSTMTHWFPRRSSRKGTDTTAHNWMSSDATGKGLDGRPPRFPPDGLGRLPAGPRPPAASRQATRSPIPVPMSRWRPSPQRGAVASSF